MKTVAYLFAVCDTDAPLPFSCSLFDVPFAARYRLSDLAFSNLFHAGISDIRILTNEKMLPSVAFDIHPITNGTSAIISFTSQGKSSPDIRFYAFCDALRRALSAETSDTVVISDIGNVNNVNLTDVLMKHEKRNTDVTAVTVKAVPGSSEKSPQLFITPTGDDKVLSFRFGKIAAPLEERSLNLFVFRRKYLLDLVKMTEYITDPHTFCEKIQKEMAKNGLSLYRHYGYLSSVKTLCDYFRTQIELCENAEERCSLFSPESPIITAAETSMPTFFRKNAEVKNCLVGDGCVIEGYAENSVLFGGVHLSRGAVVRNSIIFENTFVGEKTSLSYVIAEKKTFFATGLTLSGHRNTPLLIGGFVE